VMIASDAPADIVAILDWELATIGDPLADLGYLLATWAEAGAPDHPMLLSTVTAREGFPTCADLATRYAEITGRDIAHLSWYRALALWKSAVFCEAILGRWRRGERRDTWAGTLRDGVPRLVELAASHL
jgi:aminoglycoside phosphotransferase (APT) family kinase protein